MAKQIHIIYNDTEPFQGYIVPGLIGKIDPVIDFDLVAHLESVAGADSNLHLAYVPLTDALPDPEKEKYNWIAGEIVPLNVGDITPAAAEETIVEDAETEIAASPITNMSMAELEQYVEDALDFPDETTINTWVDNNVTDLASAKTALKYLGKAILDSNTFAKKHARLTLAILKYLRMSK